MKNGFAVRFARVTQHHSQNPRTTSATVGIHHPSAGAKINLRFLARLYLDPLDGLWAGLTKLAHEAFDRLIGTGELNLDHQVLINPLSAQSGFQLGLDAQRVRITKAGPTRITFEDCRDHLRPGGLARW